MRHRSARNHINRAEPVKGTDGMFVFDLRACPGGGGLGCRMADHPTVLPAASLPMACGARGNILPGPASGLNDTRNALK